MTRLCVYRTSEIDLGNPIKLLGHSEELIITDAALEQCQTCIGTLESEQDNRTVVFPLSKQRRHRRVN